MAQQINLYSPILLTPKRYFSASALAQSLGVLVFGLCALAAWSTLSAQHLAAGLEAARAANAQEQAQLTAALARRPAAGKDTQALQQQLAQARKALAERRALLATRDASHGGAGTDHGEVLRLLAETIPDTLWLTEVKRAGHRLELAGVALQPQALQPWLAQLSRHPLMAGAPLRAIKVERSDGAAAGAEAWSFRVVSGGSAGEPS
jgi:Tfp pilus assembly protein PilN